MDILDKLSKLRQTVEANTVRSNEVSSIIHDHKKILAELRLARVNAVNVALINEEIAHIEIDIAKLQDKSDLIEFEQERQSQSLLISSSALTRNELRTCRTIHELDNEISHLLDLADDKIQKDIMLYNTYFMSIEDEQSSYIELDVVQCEKRCDDIHKPYIQNMNEMRCTLQTLLAELETETMYVQQLKRLYPHL